MRNEELTNNKKQGPKVVDISENDVVVLDDLSKIPDNSSFLTDGYIVFVCTQGRGTCQLNGKEVEMQKNDLVFVSYQQLVSNVMTSIDFKARGFIMSVNYLESIFLLTGKFWSASFVVRNNPVIPLDEEGVKQYLLNYEFLSNKLRQPRTEHFPEMIRLLHRSMIYDFYDHVATKLQLPNYTYTSAENIFSRFMKMAQAETPRQREVGYYADRLCITPKYLSVICKNASGKTASAILSAMTVEHIKNKLRNSDMSVKEIANEAGFTNLSFFGKYVKRELGMAPREYRTK